MCWPMAWWVKSAYHNASEFRKQHSVATDLIVGLLRLIMKDIAWLRKESLCGPRATPDNRAKCTRIRSQAQSI